MPAGDHRLPCDYAVADVGTEFLKRVLRCGRSLAQLLCFRVPTCEADLARRVHIRDGTIAGYLTLRTCAFGTSIPFTSLFAMVSRLVTLCCMLVEQAVNTFQPRDGANRHTDLGLSSLDKVTIVVGDCENKHMAYTIRVLARLVNQTISGPHKI